jgi:hypothetical protein
MSRSRAHVGLHLTAPPPSPPSIPQAQNYLRGIFELVDSGKDSKGSATGGGGDGVLSREELSGRVDPVLREYV